MREGFFLMYFFFVLKKFKFEVNSTQIYSTTMKNLKYVPNLYAIQNKVKTGFVLEHADYSKKSLAK